MKLIAVLGSPRPHGNTDTLAACVVEGAAEAGLATETVALRALTIEPCFGCEQCWREGAACILADDMLPLYDAIAAGDIVLLATPVYWYAPTALMKAFMDRLVPFNRPQGRPLIAGKGAISVVAYEEEGPEPAAPLLRMLEMSFAYLEMELIDQIVVDGVGPKGAVLQKPQALEHARAVGRKLARWHRAG